MNNPYADCITFTENEITLRSLDHPQRVSKFIRCLRSILQQGYTGTREAGRKLRNDILNTMRREARIVVLDFTHVQTVSSSFIDEFMAKLVLDLGFAKFNELIRISGMNERVTFLFERSLYMRISTEWNKQAVHSQSQKEN